MSIFGILFEAPWFLAGLFLLPLIRFIEWKWNEKRPGLKIGWQHLPEVKVSLKMRLFKTGKLARYAAAACILIALGRPVLPLQEQEIKAESIEIALVIDLSSSMLAMDFEPNRLEAAKAVAKSFVSERVFDLFTVIAFAGESYTVVPLTNDKNILTRQLDALECGKLEDGTAIGMGLATAVNRLRQGKTKEKVIILLTDGVNNAGYIQPQTAAKMAEDLGYKVYTVGVGTLGEALSPVSRRGDGQYLFGYTRVEIDEPLMKDIAQKTGGKYFRATDLPSLKAIYQEIDELEKTEIEISTTLRYKEQFPFYLGIALLFILLDLLFRNILIRRAV